MRDFSLKEFFVLFCCNIELKGMLDLTKQDDSALWFARLRLYKSTYTRTNKNRKVGICSNTVCKDTEQEYN